MMQRENAPPAENPPQTAAPSKKQSLRKIQKDEHAACAFAQPVAVKPLS
jgi:hypothetical protein